MPYYLKKENTANFTNWLKYKIKQIPDLVIYYRSDHREDFEALFHDEYPFTIFICWIDKKGIMYPDLEACFFMEQVGERVKLAIKIHPSLIKKIEPIIAEMHQDWPETLELTDIEKAALAWVNRDSLWDNMGDFLANWDDQTGNYYTERKIKDVLHTLEKKRIIEKGSNNRWRMKNLF